MLQFHMAKSALHGSLGVVTHSEFARKQVEAFASFPLIHIYFPTPKIRSKSIPKAFDGKIHFLSLRHVEQQ